MGGQDDPEFTPKGKYLLSYDNTDFEHDNLCVYLMAIEPGQTKNTYTLRNYINLNFDRLNVKELVWINDKSFAMSVTEQTNPGDYDVAHKLTYYLKVSLTK